METTILMGGTISVGPQLRNCLPFLHQMICWLISGYWWTLAVHCGWWKSLSSFPVVSILLALLVISLLSQEGWLESTRCVMAHRVLGLSRFVLHLSGIHVALGPQLRSSLKCLYEPSQFMEGWPAPFKDGWTARKPHWDCCLLSSV